MKAYFSTWAWKCQFLKPGSCAKASAIAHLIRLSDAAGSRLGGIEEGADFQMRMYILRCRII